MQHFSNSSSAKAEFCSSPKVDVIQDRPVTMEQPAKSLGTQHFQQPPVDATFSGKDLGHAKLVEGPALAAGGEKSPPFLLELFCGTAGVCAQFRVKGGRALGVDHHLKRHKLKSAAVKLDLTQQWVQDLIEREVRLKRISVVHMGPPCGTASKARNIPIKRKLRQKGAPNPQPLRSSTYPLGFPWLKGLSKAKVDAANSLYEFSSRLATLCSEFQIPFTIENPANSFMWETPYFARLILSSHFHVLHACEYGSIHKKATGILANFRSQRLMKRCSGNHKHEAWKIQQSPTGEWSFDTAKEAEYSTQFASEVAAALLDELSSREALHLSDDVGDHAVKISAENQPRRTRGPLLLSEFKSKIEVTCAANEVPPEIIPQEASHPWQGLPVGAKRVEIQPVDDEQGCGGRLKVVYGVHFSPEEFVVKAQGLTHPFDIPLPLDESNMESMRFILERGPAEVAKFRAEKLKHYVNRAKQLKDSESELHRSLDEDVQKVMHSKRLLLFREMLDDAGIKDESLFKELCTGFRLVGDIDASGQFTEQFKPAILGVEQLRQTAVWAQKAVVPSCRRVLEDLEVAQAVWSETLEQAAPEKGWVLGPFTSAQVTERLGDQWIPSRRFGVRQGGKIRPVDDFSQFLINSTVTCHEKIDLEGIDHICATARFFLGAPNNHGGFSIPSASGISEARLAPTWSQECVSDLHGRCLDLKQAYKQLVRHPADRWASVLAVTNPEDAEVYFFEAVALPFGSISSVMAFNRSARALRTILAKLFRLVVTNFFDDFCQLELGVLCNSAWATAEAVMALLGWKISTGEDKRRPFSKTFEILGAVVQLPEPGTKTIEVSNKQSRLLQLQEQVCELRSHLGSHISRTKIESLKGRLLYAAGHTYGRCTQLACQLLHKFGGSGPTTLVTPELAHATAEALSSLMESKPRAIQAWSSCPPILMFTDGAVEDNADLVTHGAVLIDPWKRQSFFFGDHVPKPFVETWRRSGKRQVIAQAELFPILVAKASWGSHLFGRSVLWFLDNESARAALIRNFSPVLDNFHLLQLNAKMDIRIQARQWYNRVPSKSNPADEASRLDFKSYLNAEQCQPCYDFLLNDLQRFWKLMDDLERGCEVAPKA